MVMVQDNSPTYDDKKFRDRLDQILGVLTSTGNFSIADISGYDNVLYISLHTKLEERPVLEETRAYIKKELGKVTNEYIVVMFDSKKGNVYTTDAGGSETITYVSGKRIR